MRNIKKEIKDLTWFDMLDSLKSILRYLSDKSTSTIDVIIGKGLSKDSEGKVQLGTTNQDSDIRTIDLSGEVLVIKSDTTDINDVIFDNGYAKSFKSDLEILSSGTNLATVSATRKMISDSPVVIPESLLKKVDDNTKNITKNTDSIESINTLNKKFEADIAKNSKDLKVIEDAHKKDVSEINKSIDLTNSSISNLTTLVEKNTSDIKVNSKSIEKNSDSINTNSEDIKKLKLKDDVIYSDIEGMKKDISKNSSDIVTNKENITKVDKKLTDSNNLNSKKFSDLDNKNISQDSKIESNTINIGLVKTNQESLLKKVDDNTKNITKNTDSIESINTLNKKFEADIAKNSKDISSNKTSILNFETKLDKVNKDLSERVTKVETDVSAVSTSVSELKKDSVKIKSDILDIDSRVKTNSSNILINSNSINDLSLIVANEVSKTTKIGNDLSKVDDRVKILEGTIVDSAVDISKMKKDIDTNKKDISEIKVVNRDQKVLNKNFEDKIIESNKKIDTVNNKLTADISNLSLKQDKDFKDLTLSIEATNLLHETDKISSNKVIGDLTKEVDLNTKDIIELKKGSQKLEPGEGISIDNLKINIGVKTPTGTLVELGDNTKHSTTVKVGVTESLSETGLDQIKSTLTTSGSKFTETIKADSYIADYNVGSKTKRVTIKEGEETIESDIPIRDKSTITFGGIIKSDRTAIEVLSDNSNIVNVTALKSYSDSGSIKNLSGKNGVSVKGNVIELGIDSDSAKSIDISFGKDINTKMTSNITTSVSESLSKTNIVKDVKVDSASTKTVLDKDRMRFTSNVPLELNSQLSTNTSPDIILSKGSNITTVDSVVRIINNNKINITPDVGSGIQVDTSIIRLGDENRNINIVSLDETNKVYFGVLEDKVEFKLNTKKDSETEYIDVNKTERIDKTRNSFERVVEIEDNKFSNYELDLEVIEWKSLYNNSGINQISSFPNYSIYGVKGTYTKNMPTDTEFSMNEVTGIDFINNGSLALMEGTNSLIAYTPGVIFEVFLFDYDKKYLGETKGYIEVTDSKVIEHYGYVFISIKTATIPNETKFKLYNGDDLTAEWSPTLEDIDNLIESVKSRGTKTRFSESTSYTLESVIKNTDIGDKTFTVNTTDKGIDLQNYSTVKVDDKNIVREVSGCKADDKGSVDLILDAIKLRSPNGTIFSIVVKDNGILSLSGEIEEDPLTAITIDNGSVITTPEGEIILI